MIENWQKMDTDGMPAPFHKLKAWWRGTDSMGAIYKVDGMYYLYCWGFLKGHKYKYLKEAQAVMDALARLGELGSMAEVENTFGFEPGMDNYRL